LFNSYYNGIGEKYPRPHRGLISRPGLAKVLAYRSNVERRVADLLSASGWNPDLMSLVELGINHEQQHQELMLTDFKHLLSCNPLLPAYRDGWPLTTASSVALTWASFDGGLVEIGATGDQFSFDHEQPRHRTWLAPYELASRPLTHGDLLDFVDDGGYQRPELWLSLGWDCVIENGWTQPMYWQKRDGAWFTFTLRGPVPVARDVPATHLSYFEADALARWLEARLPTEAEWEAAAANTLIEGNFVEHGIFHPLTAPRVFQGGELAQLWGDVWEWTQSAYSAYPGFKAAPGAAGEYNGKFMCNQYVLRGGSCVTPQSHIRASYRNFFPPSARWQFSGVRLARSLG
jgi:ergothioneine biosynthesis protein EgtB